MRISSQILLMSALSTACWCACSGDSSGDAEDQVAEKLPEEYVAARQRLLDEVLLPDQLDHPVRVLGLTAAVPAGTEVVGFPLSTPPDEEPDGIPEPAYVFWIDDAPGSFFGHDSRIVVVPTDGGDTTILPIVFWPLVAGEPVFGLDASLPGDVDEVFRSPGVEAPVPQDLPGADSISRFPLNEPLKATEGCPPGEDPPKDYVVLVSGGGVYDDKLTYSMTRMTKEVKGLYSLPAESTVAGSQFYKLDCAQAGQGGGQTCRDELQAHMQSLAGSMRCCDRLLFYYTGHGMRMNAVKVTQGDASATWWCSKSKIAIGSGKGYICADDSGSGRLFKFPEDATMEDAPEQKDYWNVMMGDQPFWNEADPFSLGEWLSQINSCHMTAIVEACYSGGFQDPLLAQPGVRSVLVATGDDEPLESAPDKLGTENTAALLKGLATVDRSTATVDDVWVKAEQAAEANSYQDLDEDAASVKTNPCGCKCNPDGTRSRGRQKADGTEECADAPVETCSGDAYSCCYLTCAHAYSLACHPCEAFCEALSDAGVSGDCAAACAAWFNEQTFETCQEVPGLAESCPDPSCL